MPSKYSHSVVLANYSSQGIISFPANKQSDAITAAPPSSPSDKPEPVTGHVPISISSPKERPATVASNHTVRSSSRQNASGEYSQPRPVSQGRRSRLQTHTPRSDLVNGESQKENPSNYTGTPSRKSAKENGTSDARLTSPFDPSHHHPEWSPAGQSPGLSSKPRQDQNGIQPQRRTMAYAAQTVQSRPGPPLSAGIRPPPVSVKRAPSKATSNTRGEALLSLQQFLDSSARIQKHVEVPKPRAQTPNPRSPPKALLASPELSSETIKPTSAGRKNGTSFIDSSDEDDHVDNTPGTSVRSAKTAPTILPKPGPPTEQNMAPSAKESAFSGKMRLDLTKSLPASPDRDGSSADELQPPPRSPLRAFRAVQTHTRQVSEELDDPFGPLPLQKHSPLRSTKTQDKRRSLGLPYPSLRQPQAGSASSREWVSTRSAESLPLQSRNMELEPHFSDLADSGDDDREREEDTPSISNIHVHRRYYRSVDTDIPEDESRPQITTANSWNSRRAAARTPTPVPWQSPVRETTAQEATAKEEDDLDETPKQEPNILTNATPHASRTPAPQMPNFGVPSIVRSPGTSPEAKKQQYQHMGGMETMTKPPRLSGSRSLQRYKQARSQHPPLSRIMEARPQDEAPSTPTWKLPAVEASDPGVFGAEILMRLSSEYDTGTESEMERTSDNAAFTTSQRRDQDNFTTDFSTIPIDQVVARDANHRSPAKAIPRNTASTKNIGSATSLPTTRAEVARPRTRYGRADHQDNDLADDDDDDEDYEHVSADAPPDIIRHRRTRDDEGTDQDGLQSLIHALRAGPNLTLTSPARTAAKQQLTGIDRFEEMMRRADEEERRRRQSKNKVGAVFGRFLRR